MTFALHQGGVVKPSVCIIYLTNCVGEVLCHSLYVSLAQP